jgi:hypothetical protein
MGSRFWRGAFAAVPGIFIAAIAGCSTSSTTGSALTPTDSPTGEQLQAALSQEFDRLGIDPGRSVSAAPGDDCRPMNLTVTVEDTDGAGGEPATGLKLTWIERVIGDYDANGEVGISDLSPLGLHFGKTVSYGVSGVPSGEPLVSPDWTLSRVDGDLNGEINLADITAIALNWQERLDGFNVYRMGPGETEYSLIPGASETMTIARSSAIGGTPTGLVMYELVDPLSVEGDYQYLVLPYDGVSGAVGGGGIEGAPGGSRSSQGFSFGTIPDPEPEPDGEEILIIRNDGGLWNANLSALTADLDALGLTWFMRDYDADIDEFFFEWEFKTVIWYRGGPTSVSSASTVNNTPWTTAEVDDYLEILKGDGDVLLMSQSHSYRDTSMIDGTDYKVGWEHIDGYTMQDETLPDQRLAWSAGLATDDGFGPGQDWGDVYGYIPCAPTSVMGAISPKFGADSVNSAERFSGANSSGYIATGIEVTGSSQFCGIAYMSAFFAGTSAGAGFRGGLVLAPFSEISELEQVGQAQSNCCLVSYGNVSAPDENIGNFPSYTHIEGPSKLWVIGYSWGDTVVAASSAPPEDPMTRADLLQNIMAWLGHYDS